MTTTERALSFSKRSKALDYLKVIAIAAIVLHHVQIPWHDIVASQGPKAILAYGIFALTFFAVPVFFFVNGALLLNKPFDMRKHVRRLLGAVCVTLAWALISTVLIGLRVGTDLTLGGVVRNVLTFTAAGMPSVNHLWFMAVLIEIYLFFPLIKLAYDKNREIIRFILIAALILGPGDALVSMLFNVVTTCCGKGLFYPDFNTSALGQFNKVGCLTSSCVAFFIIGGLLYEKREQVTERLTVGKDLVAMLVSLVCMVVYGMMMSAQTGKSFEVSGWACRTVFALVYCVCLFDLAMRLEQRLPGREAWLVKEIGMNTLGIYFVHWILRSCLGNGSLSGVPRSVSVVLVWLGVLFASLAISMLGRKIPGVRKLFSL